MDESGAIPGIQWDGTDTDWVKETFEAAPMQKHNLSSREEMKSLLI